jgi:DNA polymerase-3 subunit alpha
VDGIFQVESEGMRKVLTSMRPTEFEHIIAVVALYRPGPMDYIASFVRRMHGEEEVTYHHPVLEPILKETYGICVTGDALLFDPVSGRRLRLDEAGKVQGLHLQGVAENWSPAIGQVTHWVHNGRKPVFRLTLRNGAHIKTTADHRFLTEDGWRPLAELYVGDYVAAPKQLLGPQQTYLLERLRILAYLIADGDLGNLAAANFVSAEPALLAEYERCVKTLPNVRLTATEQARGVTRLGSAKADQNETYHTPNALLAWLRELGLKHAPGATPGGCRSHEKFIPDFVFALSEDLIAFFLASLWDCDGYMGAKLCHYKTISAQLAADVQTLLLRLGIRSTVYTAEYERQGRSNGKSAERRTSYQVTTYDTARLAELLQPHMLTAKRHVICLSRDHPTIGRSGFIGEVDAATSLSRRALMTTYGIDRQHFYPGGTRRERIGAHIASGLAEHLPLVETRRRLNVNWEEIVSIELAGVEDVYDLTVEGLHSFVANNIIVHNCVYQEQIIQIATQMAGYSPGEADQIRKAVGKKIQAEIARHREQFISGCLRGGYTPAVAEAVYGDIEFFANYGFNKAHAADYAMITCQTAYLKAHYPVEYMTALLSVSRHDIAKVAIYCADARRQGIPVLPPDVNRSGLDFTIEERSMGQSVDRSTARSVNADQLAVRPGDRSPSYAIRFGLAAVKNVGEGAVQIILDARRAGGPFTSLDDFCQRVDLRQVGKRPLECLIKVGALDAFGASRAQALDGLDQIINASASHFRAAEAGQLSLFGGAGSGFSGVQLGRAKSEITRREMLSWEKELIGLYVSDHPLQPVIDDIQSLVTDYSQQLTEDDHGRPVVMAGVVTNIRHHHTKRGDLMGFVSLDDLQGHLELVVFPRTWQEVSPWLALEQIVVVYGKVDSKGQGQPKIIVDQLTREFKLTRPADTAGPSGRPAARAGRSPSSSGAPGNGRPAPAAPAARLPALASTAAAPSPGRSVWDEDEGPAPWLDDEIPLPDGDWQPHDAEPATEPQPPAAATPSGDSPPPQPRPQRPEAQARAGGGEHPGEAAPPSAPLAGPTAQTPAPEPARAPKTNGGRNIAGQDNGQAQRQAPLRRPAAGQPAAAASPIGSAVLRARLREASAAAPPPAGQPARRLVITVQSSGDKERDKRRMRRLHGLLTSYPGNDHFEFAVLDYDDRSYQLRFPNDTTGFCPALERQLHELLGAGMVEVQPL